MTCPIYIIHLKRNPERSFYIQRQLDAFGLDYRFVEVDVLDKYELESKAYRIRVAHMLGIDKQAWKINMLRWSIMPKSIILE